MILKALQIKKKGPTDAEPEPDPVSLSISLYLHGTKRRKRKKKRKLRTRELRFSSSLTSDRRDHTVAIFYQLFEKFAGPLQLHLVALERLSELGTVQIAVAELQRRMPHLLTDGLVKTTGEKAKWVFVSRGATQSYTRLPHAAHCCSVVETTLICGGQQEPWCPWEPCGGSCSLVKCTKQWRGPDRVHFPLLSPRTRLVKL